MTVPPRLWELLVRRASTDPDRVLVEDDRGRTLTARTWLERSERLAAGLRSQGVEQETVVTWQLPASIEACVLTMAIARLGAVQNPLVPILRSKEVGFVVRETGARLLITPKVWRNFDYEAMATGIAAETGVDSLVLGPGTVPEGDPADLSPPATIEDDPVRHIYYTSGSTADPKGVKHTDRSLMHAALGLITRYSIGPSDCLTVPFPYAHAGGLLYTMVSLKTGCRLLLIEIFDRQESPLVMSRNGATLLGSAVPFFQAYLEAQSAHGSELLFPRLKAFNGGGAPKPPELYYEMKRVFGVGIVSGWGMTEFPSASGGRLDDSDEELAYTEGQPLPGVDVRVVNEKGLEVEPGQEGELRLKGKHCFRGYVESGLDEGAFDENGFLRTGDLGLVGPRGHIKITGRIKDIIIRNAENISAQEVEDVLYQHPKVADVAVVGLPDPVTGERACAVVVLANGAESLTLSEVADFCRANRMASQKIPERIELRHELPRNALGKVLKRELRAQLQSR